MIKDTVHPVSEFAGLPWGDLDPERFGYDWTVSRGGHGLPGETWTIKIFKDRGGMDVAADIWALPAPLGTAIGEIKRIAEKSGQEEARRSIKVALGLP